MSLGRFEEEKASTSCSRRSRTSPIALAIEGCVQPNSLPKVEDYDEADADPDGRGADSNPNGVVTDGAGAAYVVDAGGNDLLRIDADGEITVGAVFPNRTVVAVFPDRGDDAALPRELDLSSSAATTSCRPAGLAVRSFLPSPRARPKIPVARSADFFGGACDFRRPNR